MNRVDIEKVLSLSCVENYFLGYFQKRIDVRSLYVESFVAFNKVIDAFLNGCVSYVNYPLDRLQETSEKLGITTHELHKNLQNAADSLILIRVNKNFFSNSKLLPWRMDHYIAIDKTEDEYTYLNNYPLSEGVLSEKQLYKVYDNACLIFRTADVLNEQAYDKLCCLQYARLAEQSVNTVQVYEGNTIPLRDALLVLKTLRKRISAWLLYEAERKRFDDDLSFRVQSDKLLKLYENLLVVMQLQIARKRFDVDTLNEKFARLCEQEHLWGKSIQIRKG